MATVFPRWKVILVGVCSLVLSCLLLLTVSHITSSVGTSYYSQPGVKTKRLVLNPVVLPPSRRRLAENNSSKWGNASRYGYTPLAEPTDTIIPATENKIRMGNRYVLSLDYWEELTMATNSWIQLALVAKHWGAYAVRPFTESSYLHGIPSRGSYSVDIIYDPQEMDRKLAEYSMPRIASFEEFLAKAGRRVILLNLDYMRSELHVQKCRRGDGQRIASALAVLSKEASKKGYPAFQFYNCCKVHGQHPTHPNDIAKGCGLDRLDEYTVITPEWRGITHVLSYRLLTPEVSDINHPNYDYDIYPHSKEVIGNATAFIQEATGGEDYIAMHYRLESFVIRNNPQLTDYCLDYVPKATRKIQEQYPNLRHLLIFGDEEISHARATKHFKIKESVSHFPIGRFGSIHDRGFAGQVEQNVMSRARVLITAGCGSFQALTVSRFYREPTHIKRYHVCNCQE